MFLSVDLTWQTTGENKGTALPTRPSRRDIMLLEQLYHKCVGTGEMLKEDYVRTVEIEEDLRRATNSAPGTDRILYEDIVERSEGELEELASIYNSSIEKAAVHEN